MKKSLMFVALIMLIITWRGSYSATAHPVGRSGTPSPVAPHATPIIPTYFKQADFAELSADRVYNELVARGLVDNASIGRSDNGNSKYKFKSEIIFIYKGFKGHICEFDNEHNLNEAQEEALELNEKGTKYNWSMIHKNILFSIDGELPLADFQNIQEVLRGL